MNTETATTQTAASVSAAASESSGARLPAAADCRADLGDAAIAARLTEFLARHLECDVRLDDVVRLTGGLSWITVMFIVRAACAPVFDGRALVVKIGSPQGLMAPYSALPQAGALEACDGSDVPVPKLLWYSDDPSILGAPFLITDKVAGRELNPFVRDYGMPEGAALGEIGTHFADALAALHSLPPERLALPDSGIDALTRAGGATQVEFWRGCRERWARRPYPLVALAEAWLLRHSPEPVRKVIVHGDYRVGNFLVCDTRITAILDWEMAHPGDPHEDLCWVLLPELRLRGLISPTDFLARYQARSGIEVQAEAMRYYGIFTLYKMAVINMGGTAGLESGSKDLRMACLGFNVPMYLDHLGKALEEAL